MTTEERQPAEVFHPGEFVREEMEARGWDKARLAAEMGVSSPDLLDKLLDFQVAVTPPVAEALGKAFGNGSILWLNLQKSWDKSAAAERARLLARARGIRDEIARMLADAAHWNEHVRTPFEQPIDPDPGGEIKRLAARLDRMLARG